MNKINLIGRLTKDPELKTYDDKSKATFTIAVNRGYKDETDFINCEVWNKQAENLCKYQVKGNMIGVSGSLNINKYETKDGDKKEFTFVKVDSIDFLTPKDRDTEQLKQLHTKTKVDPYQEFGDAIEITDEDLPF